MQEREEAAAAVEESNAPEEPTREQLFQEIVVEGKVEAESPATDDEPIETEPKSQIPDTGSGTQGDFDASGDTDTEDTGDDTKEQTIADLQRQLERTKGSQSGLQKKLDKVNRELEQLRESRANQGADDSIQEAKANLEAAAEEYPDVVGPVAERLKGIEGALSKLSAGEQRQEATLESERAELQQELDGHLEREWGVFTTAHPNGAQFIQQNSAAFSAWVDDQPRAIREAYAANKDRIVDGQAAATLLAAFKDSLGRTPSGDTETRLQNRRQRQLESAETTRSNTPQGTSRLPDDTQDRASLWKEMRKDGLF